ncbi:hypothetical protein [Leucobacter komagatae]|uniref:hypothetical protein n=1 Tax=Leucobacter komagatae TaxID=55969 RepID=UPI0012ECF6DE|nr:hypothetical protein [Leucobacter komagatae]
MQLTPLLRALHEAEKEYRLHCGQGQFTYATSVKTPVALANGEMTALYNEHLRGKNGREFYDEVINDDQGLPKLCSYCGERAAEQADHYKEKSKYPLLAVFPANLVPSCGACNWNLRGAKNKFHPYFDDIGSSKWLTAEIIWDGSFNPPGLRFFVPADFVGDTALAKRVSDTFKDAKLSRRWSSEISRMVAQAHRYFLSTTSIRARENHLEDMRTSHLETPAGPHQAVIDAMLCSAWIQDLPASL